MTGFELFFRTENFNSGVHLFPNFPPSEKSKKNYYKIFSSASKNRKQNQNKKITNSGTSCESQVRQNAFSALMEKKAESCAVLKIDALFRFATKNSYFKMTGFELFFRTENFNSGVHLFPNFPPSENSKKTITKFFHRLQKIENKIKIKISLIQALAANSKCVRTHFQPLWKRNQRVALF